MNKLSKWWGEIRGKRLCYYCPETWMDGFVGRDNTMFCPNCKTMYQFKWVYSWPHVEMRTPDIDKLESIHIDFYRISGGIRKEGMVIHRLLENETVIYTNFDNLNPRPQLAFPLMKDKITPFNVQDRVKTILTFT